MFGMMRCRAGDVQRVGHWAHIQPNSVLKKSSAVQARGNKVRNCWAALTANTLSRGLERAALVSNKDWSVHTECTE